MGAPVFVSAIKGKNHVPSVLPSRLEVEAALGVADALNGRFVDEPATSITGGLIDKRTRKARDGTLLEDLLHNTLLSTAGGNECDANGVRDDRQGQCNPLGRRLGAVLDGGNPGGALAQELMTRE